MCWPCDPNMTIYIEPYDTHSHIDKKKNQQIVLSRMLEPAH